MTTLVVFLRGINVGRAKRVGMAELRAALTEVGLQSPQTLLQSGNVVLGSGAHDPAQVPRLVRETVAEQLGVDCAVIVRTVEELAAALDADPLLEVASDPTRHLLGFAESPVEPAAAAAVEALGVEPNVVRVVGGTVYLWCPDGVLSSPFATVRWQKVLGSEVTMRNRSTLDKLRALTDSAP